MIFFIYHHKIVFGQYCVGNVNTKIISLYWGFNIFYARIVHDDLLNLVTKYI